MLTGPPHGQGAVAGLSEAERGQGAISHGPAGYKVNISRGQRIGRVSSEWLSRPDDERFLSLSELHVAVKARPALE